MVGKISFLLGWLIFMCQVSFRDDKYIHLALDPSFFLPKCTTALIIPHQAERCMWLGSLQEFLETSHVGKMS